MATQTDRIQEMISLRKTLQDNYSAGITSVSIDSFVDNNKKRNLPWLVSQRYGIHLKRSKGPAPYKTSRWYSKAVKNFRDNCPKSRSPQKQVWPRIVCISSYVVVAMLILERKCRGISRGRDTEIDHVWRKKVSH